MEIKYSPATTFSSPSSSSSSPNFFFLTVSSLAILIVVVTVGNTAVHPDVNRNGVQTKTDNHQATHHLSSAAGNIAFETPKALRKFPSLKNGKISYGDEIHVKLIHDHHQQDAGSKGNKMDSGGEDKAEVLPSSNNESLDSKTQTTFEPKDDISPKKPRAPKIRQISIIGERNSGTTWTAAHLTDCFGNDIIVNDRLVRYKHWFQHDVVENKRVNSTLVIAQFRNPYHWIEGMKAKPHHAPMHNHKDWRTFVTTPWTMPRTDIDLDKIRTHGTLIDEELEEYDTSDIECKAYYKYHQINSCVDHPFPEGDKRYEGYFRKGEEPGWSGYKPTYELRSDGSGRPYGSIIELRADKIRNFLEIESWDWIGAFKVVQYEELVKRGTSYMINFIEEMTGLKAKCQAYPAQNRTQRNLPPTFVQWMNDYVDWEAEKLIGYEPMEVSGIRDEK